MDQKQYRSLTPGMRPDLQQQDSKGFQTTVDMVTGKGDRELAMECGGIEVGSNYDATAMGEEYRAVSYTEQVAMPNDIGGAKKK